MNKHNRRHPQQGKRGTDTRHEQRTSHSDKERDANTQRQIKSNVWDRKTMKERQAAT